MKKSNSFLLILLIILITVLTLTSGCSNEEGIEVYFCHHDDCAGRIEEEVRKASESIYFMSYTFTNGRVASELILKSKEGVDVKGIFEKGNINAKNSKYELLKFQGIDVKTDNNSGLMHHKVFIIDKNVVITGSFNPTEAGDKRNDDNIIIVKDENVARKYFEEFNRLFFEK